MKIKEIVLTGTYKDDKDILKIKDQYQSLLEDKMRAAGRVPVLNINPLWRTSWDNDKEHYDFEITMFGVYIGKRKAQEVIGWDSLEDKWYNV